MEFQSQLPTEAIQASQFRKYVFLFCIFSLISLIFSLSVGDATSLTKRKNPLISKSVVASARPAAPVGINWEPNPATTNGPACTQRVIVLIDRSHSIMNKAPAADKYQYVREIKNAVNWNIGLIGLDAETKGNLVTVTPIAFAAKAVDQNQPSLYPDFFSFSASTNVADPASRTNMIDNIIGADETDGIYFRDSTLDPDYKSYLPGNPAKNHESFVKGYPTNDNGSTNYEDAFIKARDTIDFWTSPTDSGDDDFDLVLMVTDGIPTSHNANLSGPWVNPDDDDLAAAQGSINALRLGAFGTIPKTPVMGIVVGSDAVRPDADSIMLKTFGPGNYALESNWGNLTNRIRDMISPDCSPPVPINPSISATVKATPPSIFEGQDSTISVEIENTGDVPLTVVSATIQTVIGGVPQPMDLSVDKYDLVPFPTLFPANAKQSFNLRVVHAALGGPSTLDFLVSVGSYAVFDSRKSTINSGSSTPVVTNIPVSISVNRVPLPA